MKCGKGFILLPVVLTLIILSSLAYLLNRDSSQQANSAGREFDMDQAGYVAQAAANQAVWKLNQLSCSNYSAISNASLNGFSYSSTVSPSSGSPVTVSITTTSADGTKTTLQRNRTAVYQNQQTQIIQSSPTMGTDTSISNVNTGYNYGGEQNLTVSAVNGAVYRSLLAFDLTGLGRNTRIVRAQLQLYQTNPSAAGLPIGVHAVTSAWVEGNQSPGANGGGATWLKGDSGANWSNAGGDFIGTFIAQANPSGEGWMSWDITQLVALWNAGSLVNNGLMLLPESLGSDASFASSENSTSSLAPKLNLTYACECGQSCSLPTDPGGSGGSGGGGSGGTGGDPLFLTKQVLETQVVLVPNADTYLDTSNPSTKYGSAYPIIAGSNGGSAFFNSLLYFNVLANVPANAFITSAQLRMYEVSMGAGGGATLEVHKLTRSWSESQATALKATGSSNWSRSGGDYGPAVVSSASVLNTGGWDSWEVTALVQEWVDGISPDYGLALVRQQPSAGLVKVLYASRNGGVGGQPQLVINYLPAGTSRY